MRRANSQAIRDDAEEGMPGEDSFLDIIANIVGILIILVMVVGVRASQGILMAETPAKPVAPAKQLVSLAAVAESASAEDAADQDPKQLERDIARLAQKLEKQNKQALELTAQRMRVESQRDQMLEVQAIQQRDLERRRNELDEKEREQYDVQREMMNAHIELKKLTQQEFALVNQTVEDVEEVECVPTPLAKEVDGDSIHIRLRHGRLALIPVNELVDEIRGSRINYLQQGVRERGEAVDIAGPIHGFRMRISILRVAEMPLTTTPLMAAAKVRIIQRSEFLPVSEKVGEIAEQALLPDSTFMRRIRARRSTSESVVAWVYPDSYDELRDLKRALWEAGVPLAVWPLDNDDPIVFSSEGSKAAAQ